MSQFHPLKIAAVRRETPDAVSIAFEVPDELREAYRFVPGQYLTLRTRFGEEEARRSYSICSGLDDPQLRVAVKKVEGGLFSCFANEQLQPGMTVDVMTPEGRFTAAPESGAARSYVAFASGSGVTPILSIVKSLLPREPASRFTLFYGNRTTDSIIFREELEDLKDRFLDRFTLVHVLSRENQDIDLLFGRLDPQRIERLAAARLFDPAATDAFFVCGPGDMIESARQALSALGVPADKVRSELFVPADGEVVPRRPASARAREAAEAGVAVEAIIDGSHRRFTMTDSDENVIDAAHRHGVELPYSCKGGMCCTCRCKVVEGEAEMAVNYSLQPWEIEQGFILSCQARPLTRSLVLDYDAV